MSTILRVKSPSQSEFAVSRSHHHLSLYKLSLHIYKSVRLDYLEVSQSRAQSNFCYTSRFLVVYGRGVGVR